MGDCFAALHDAHNSGLSLIVPIRGNPLMRRLVLLLRFLELDLIDFDAELRVCEGGVVGEFVGGRHVSAFRLFGEDTVFCACEGLESSG